MTDDPDDDIPEILSMPRFDSYLKATGGDRRAAIKLYHWNLEAASAFYDLLHWVEIGCRNAIHRELGRHFRREDWWESAPLDQNGRKTVARATAQLVRRKPRTGTADDLVTELSFGFWVSLLSKGDAYDRTLWVPALHRPSRISAVRGAGCTKRFTQCCISAIESCTTSRSSSSISHSIAELAIGCSGIFRRGWSHGWPTRMEFPQSSRGDRSDRLCFGRRNRRGRRGHPRRGHEMGRQAADFTAGGRRGGRRRGRHAVTLCRRTRARRIGRCASRLVGGRSRLPSPS